MSLHAPSVTRKVSHAPATLQPQRTELAEEHVEPALLFESLGEEWVEQVTRTGVLLRKSGFQFDALLLYFLSFLLSGRTSLKAQCESLARPAGLLLARFAGLIKFPTQSSLSRALRGVQLEKLEQIVDWLLVRSHSHAAAFLRHRLCACLDSYGGRWQLFDLDPTVTGLRQRYVHDDDDECPPAVRDCEGFAAPGYAGRKRADVIIKRTALQHVSSSLWIGSWLREGGGGARDTFPRAIDALARTCEFAEIPLDRAILRVDGEGSGVPFLAAYQQVGLHYLTRCTHDGLFEELDLPALEATPAWFEVEAGGPTRVAVDLGEHELRPGANTRQADGTAYEPVTTRIVMSRIPASSSTGAGRICGQHRYELFATSLPAEEWPADEVVKAYLHRATIENRFALEDRDLGLDKIFSYDLAGQALVTVLGLLIWNLRLLHGFVLCRDELDNEPVVRQAVRHRQPMALTTTAQAPPPPPPSPVPTEDTEHLIRELLAPALASARLPSTIVATPTGLVCANHHDLQLYGLRRQDAKDYAIFTTAPHVCDECPFRADCSRSTKPTFRKEVSVPLTESDALRRLLKSRRTERIEERRANLPPSGSLTVLPPSQAGPKRAMLASLKPRALVHRFTAALVDSSIEVHTRLHSRRAPPHQLSYASDRDRGRRRRTWTQRLSWNRLDAEITVRVFSNYSPTTSDTR